MLANSWQIQAPKTFANKPDKLGAGIRSRTAAMKLSDLKCRKAVANNAPIKLTDGAGLYLHVYPNGRKFWRLAYRYGGKQRTIAFIGKCVNSDWATA